MNDFAIQIEAEMKNHKNKRIVDMIRNVPPRRYDARVMQFAVSAACYGNITDGEYKRKLMERKS